MLEIRDYQEKAVAETIKKLVLGDTPRVQLHMAPGSGKTVVALEIWQRLAPTLTVFFVPNIHLIYQSYLSWSRLATHSFRALAVCSGSMGRADQDEIELLGKVGVANTTSTEDIASFAALHGPKVIFCTYRSAQKLALALLGREVSIDLAFLDEAHRIAGSSEKTSTIVLDDSQLNTSKRVSMTATPRYVREKDENTQLLGMQDLAAFGSVAYTLPFRKAVERGILCDYRVVVAAVTKEEIRRINVCNDSRRTLALVATVKAIAELGLKCGLTFHASVRRATEFSHLLPQVFETVGEKTNKPYVATLNASHSANHRDAVLRKLEHHQPSLVTNVRVLGEGFDFSALDFIVMADPKNSAVEIVQNIGRVMRRHGDKEFGTVILPLLIEDGSEGYELDNTAYRQIVRVATALRAYDDMMAAAVTHQRVGTTTVGGRIEAFVERHVELIGLSDTEQEETESLHRTIKLQTVRAIVDANSSGEERVAELQAFVQQHKRMPSFKSTDRREKSLAWWVNHTCGCAKDQRKEVAARVHHIRDECNENYMTIKRLSQILGVGRERVKEALTSSSAEQVAVTKKGFPLYSKDTLTMLKTCLGLSDDFVSAAQIQNEFSLTRPQFYALRGNLGIRKAKQTGRYPRTDYNRIRAYFDNPQTSPKKET